MHQHFKALHPGRPHYLAMGRSPLCYAHSPSGRLCTRSAGHTGDHATHTDSRTMVERWSAGRWFKGQYYGR